jgi:hypothetical protein
MLKLREQDKCSKEKRHIIFKGEKIKDREKFLEEAKG